MKWQAESSVGIEEIDNQHKELLRLFSAVEKAVIAGQGWSAIHFGLLEIKHFAQFHFSFEEALMRMYGFAEYEEHSELHRLLLKKMEIVEAESLRKQTRDEVVRFFREWLLDHIQGADRSYAKHILKCAKVIVPKTT